MKTENPRDWLNPKPTKPHHQELPEGQEFPKECQGRNCNSYRISSVPDGLGGNGRIHTNGRGFADVHCFDKQGVFLGALCQKCYDQNLHAVEKGRFSELCVWDNARQSFELTAESVASYVPKEKCAPKAEAIYPGNSEDISMRQILEVAGAMRRSRIRAGDFSTFSISELDELDRQLAKAEEDEANDDWSQ